MEPVVVEKLEIVVSFFFLFFLRGGKVRFRHWGSLCTSGRQVTGISQGSERVLWGDCWKGRVRARRLP